MPALDLDGAFDRALAGRRLLEHPYYKRWQDGLLTMNDLGAYAEQYRIIECCLPGVLATAAETLPEGTARRLVDANLRDERWPLPHVELFEGFAMAVGAKRTADATEATRDLVALYESTASSDPIAGLSVIGTYELQAAQVAKTKGESLHAHYGLTEDGTEFWDVHAHLEQTHAAWTVEALRVLRASPNTVETFAVMSADAWWAFLDEQDATRSI